MKGSETSLFLHRRIRLAKKNLDFHPFLQSKEGTLGSFQGPWQQWLSDCSDFVTGRFSSWGRPSAWHSHQPLKEWCLSTSQMVVLYLQMFLSNLNQSCYLHSIFSLLASKWLFVTSVPRRLEAITTAEEQEQSRQDAVKIGSMQHYFLP